MMELRELHKSYRSGIRSFEAIRGVSAKIEDGAFVVLLGPSGSGKSTLLSLMSGLETPDSGTASYDGTAFSTLNDAERTRFRRAHVGFVFQQYALLGDLSVDKNVRMGADLAKNKAYREDIDAVGLSSLSREPCSHLSGGEQQRVAIARAVSKKPDLLFLDEPTGALDEKTGREVLSFLENLHERNGFTMIMVTHNEHIAEMADEVLLMNSGRIVGREKNAVRRHAGEIGW